MFSVFFGLFETSASHPYPLALAVNDSPAVLIFYHSCSKDFEEKIEGSCEQPTILSRNFGRHMTVRLSDRPQHRETMVVFTLDLNKLRNISRQVNFNYFK